VPLDEGVDLRVQPARVAELDRDRPAEVGQEHLEKLRVPLLGGRELEQHRSRPVAERQHPGAEVTGDDVLREACRGVGQRALGLEAEPEVGWGVAHPLREGRLLR
jgi:hypothetical protein